MPRKQLDRLLFAQGGLCFFCRKPLPKAEASGEHLVASAKGGVNHDENCVVCCKAINALLGSMSLKEKVQAVLNQKGQFNRVTRIKQEPLMRDRDGITKRAAVLERLRRFKQARGADFRVNRLGVFGSVARDEAGAESDVDIVFETDDPNLFRTAHLRQELEEWLGSPVHIVRLRPAMNAPLRERILLEARYILAGRTLA